MPPENAAVVRQPLTVGSESRRRLSERLAVRLPGPMAFVLRLFQRVSPRSKLRQALLRQAFRQGIESLNRGDFEAVFTFWGPDSEFVPVDMDRLGLEGTRGPLERIRFQERWVADWGEFRFEPDEIIDLGDGRRLMWVGRIKGTGLSSGVPVGGECAVLLTVSAGWVVREEVYFEHAPALEAAGLSQ
jgi:ketosteroid isomerase-like protein